jgi:peptidoglycan-associated lipoprotein
MMTCIDHPVAAGERSTGIAVVIGRRSIRRLCQRGGTMKTLRITLGAAVLGAVLAGCGSSVKLDEAAPVVDARPNPNTAGGAGSGARSGAAGQSGVTTVDVGANDAANKVGRVVYFDFDSYVVRDDQRAVVEANARMLAAQKGKKMVIEGHTDERGGREYNLALGQRRAEAVARSMMLLGAADNQIEAVSYGKERPVSDGHDEASWAKNRRAELKER